ncbi:CYTH domain-containing protein [Lactobacillus agrestimuris]|uniref:CYTH domain-containing protein n=1 Tax=Lactobacillus agrestimuris TaxID=2941328 RepID=UPI002044ADBF|nr:CYTH domain-containing protein [Lactobacillus agrestimuris]
MSKNREIEAKTLLSESVYQNICKAFPVKSDFNQENYYFDTKDWELRRNKVALRIRIYDDRAEQTMKVPDKNPLQANFHEVIEINDKLSKKNAINLVTNAQNGARITVGSNIDKYLEDNFPGIEGKLRLFAWSKTNRILLNGPENCELTLDTTVYPDGYKDFELEIENTNPELINKILLQLERDFSFKQNNENTNKNKISRALKHRKQSI